MDQETLSDGRNDPYWQRRVYALIAVLAVVGFFAWACSGSGKPKTTAEVRDAAMSSSSYPTPAPTVTVTVTATPSPAKKARPVAANRSVKPCTPANVVVQVAPARGVFAGKAKVPFQITAVNTGSGTCDLDTRRVDVRVSAKSATVWSSATCPPAGSAGGIVPLRRGVPHSTTVTWNRKGCNGHRVAPGTYTVAVHSGSTSTEPNPFNLR
jgi:hypothetical protein